MQSLVWVVYKWDSNGTQMGLRFSSKNIEALPQILNLDNIRSRILIQWTRLLYSDNTYVGKWGTLLPMEQVIIVIVQYKPSLDCNHYSTVVDGIKLALLSQTKRERLSTRNPNRFTSPREFQKKNQQTNQQKLYKIRIKNVWPRSPEVKQSPIWLTFVLLGSIKRLITMKCPRFTKPLTPRATKIVAQEIPSTTLKASIPGSTR